ncbi:predicted protein [Uncinocarpus reesii 1704]|uniref:Uncharacterized protein n=1 Tax=Uncinocarpus reesii (strain UAMH 1704) TaxID=336963 RepID=C4JSQ9_UNCRE|nr:uncharacterized protein UREG_05498 [Uncinocarpus reesii 1704]EEP80656.1 predicted protein [Uncinocarpus reesii 1704]
MAFFGAFQTIPMRIIHPDAPVPLRMQGGLRLGFVLDKIGEAVGAIGPWRKSIELPATTVPALAYTSVSSTIVPSAICSVPPVTLASNLPSPTGSLTITAFTTAAADTAILPNFPEARAMDSTAEAASAAEPKNNYSWILEAQLLGSHAAKWVAVSSTYPRLPFVVVVYVLFGCALAVIFGTTSMFLMTVHTVCKEVGAKMIRKALMDSNQVALAIDEASCQQAQLLKKLQAANKAMVTSANKIDAMISSNEKLMSERIVQINHLLSFSERRANEVTNNVIDSAARVQEQYLPFPSRDGLLGEHLKKFKESLKDAKDELLEEIEAARSLIPSFKEEFTKVTSRLRESHLGNWVEVFESEKARLKSQVARIKKATQKIPKQKAVDQLIHELQEEHGELERRIVAAREDMGEACRQTEELVRELKSERSKVDGKVTAARDGMAKACQETKELVDGLLDDMDDLEQEVTAAHSDIRDAREEAEDVSLKTCAVKRDVQYLQADIIALEEDIALAQAALDSARKTLDEHIEEVMEEEPDHSDAPPYSPDAPLSALDQEILHLAGGDSDSDSQGHDSESEVPPELERNLLCESPSVVDYQEGRRYIVRRQKAKRAADRMPVKEDITWPARFRSGSPSVSRGRRSSRWWTSTTFNPNYVHTPSRHFGPE